MKSSATLLSLAAAVPAAYAIAFAGPVPTDISPNRAQVEANPLPTQAPSVQELKKRQTNANPNTCGWVDGDFASGITCSVGRTCMLYKSASINMAGCCTGGDTQNCGWSDACVDRVAFAAGSCQGDNCLLNDFVRKCTDAAAPYCVTWTYPRDGVADYGCAATSTNTVYTILQRATDSQSDTTSMALPTLSGNAVTFELINTDSADYTTPTDTPGGTGGTNSTNGKTVKRVAIGLIVGVVVAALAVVFFIIMGVCCFMKRKKKAKQLAANNQAVAAAQANRQSQFPPPAQQQQPQMQMNMPPQHGGYMPPPQQGGYMAPPPMSPQSPQPSGYFSPPPPQQQQQHQDQKYDHHASVTEYAVTPISAPSTPAPQYAQPYGQQNNNAPPMPPQQDVRAYHYNSTDGAQTLAPQHTPVSPPAQYQTPHDGAVEVDAMSAPHVPQTQTAAQPQAPVGGPVYEMGTGR